VIVALDGRYDMAAHMPSGAPVQFLEVKIGKRNGLAIAKRIRALIAAVSPDVLITYNWGAIEWAMVNRLFALARHVHIEDGFGPEERDRQFKRRIFFRNLSLSGSHTNVVLPSRTLLRIAIEQWRLPKKSLHYIANGIDCARFAVSQNNTVQGEPLVVGTVASLRPEKNLKRLIRAFALARSDRPMADLRLLIVGDGAERAALEESARDLGCTESIKFVGATDKPEYYLAKMNIFAMSSDNEQMPLTVLEAMASGLPVVSTDVGDITRMVSSANLPYVTKLSDASGLRRSLVSLVDNAPARLAIGCLNREKAIANFSYTQMAAKYAELFD
jgi:glycosyltransferase involved in cell wall biosynthesis